MKAWEITANLLKSAKPRLQSEEERDWTEEKVNIGKLDIEEQRRHWFSLVPGSMAPDCTLLGAIQATENKGRDVSKAEVLIPILQKAYDENDDITMLKYIAKLYELLKDAPVIKDHPYWKYNFYDTFEDHLAEVEFPVYPPLNFSERDIFERIHAGWIGQIVGGALGTMIEGYCTDKLRETFGEIYGYLREPSTYNDDVLFELAFLNAVRDKGSNITSEDIGLEWVSRIEYTWTAEEVAFKNMKRGIFPPESAKLSNPWNEWIGAQMRGAICGMVAPGNPKLAAELAWIDGSISHINNGILGETFNAILTSLSFVEKDVKKILKNTIELIPAKSEYYSVIKFAWDTCERYSSWEPAWRECEEKFRRYNWIHAYPNAAAEVVALYFSGNNFDECMHIIAMCGQDVDCNASQIGTIYGIIQGYAGIDKKWSEPFDDKFDSLFRGYEHTTLSNLAKVTIEAINALNQ